MTFYQRPSGFTWTDFFCGAGGASTGLVEAGAEVVLAANHWDTAIRTHSANHPRTEHLCEDVNKLNMRRLPSTTGLWASVICTEISPAGGRKHKPRGQLELLEYGSVPDEAFEATRATAMDVIRATEVHRYDVVVVENVVDFVTKWELFPWWRQGMHLLGYTSEIVSVSSAHIGDADGNTPAAQWRNRVYIRFLRKGIKAPRLEPRPRAWCQACERDIRARQAWNPGRSVGEYRKQYRYVCPNRSCRHATVEPYVLPAAAIIDWSDLGQRIGDRKRPLAASTIRKIRAGYEMYAAEPVIVTVRHGKDDSGRPFPARERPLPTQTGRIGDGVLVPPMLVPVGGWNRTAGPDPVTAPMRTLTTRETTGLLTPPGSYIVEYRGGGSDHRPTIEPLATVSAQGNHHGLVIPYRRGCSPYPTDRPLHTLSTVESGGLVQSTDWTRVDDIADATYRMIKPREQMAAQRFPGTYIVHGNIGEQTMQAGNAVSVNVARWIAAETMRALGAAS